MRTLLTCLVLLAATLCRAETVTFRSGEHPGFSRLVLDLPSGADWELGRSGQDYVLQIDPGHDFDTTAAFDRIPRDRIAALTPVPGTGRLRLEMACLCHASAFLYAPGQLVIDIVDGPAQPDSPFEIALQEDDGTGQATGSFTSEPAQMPVGLDLLPDPFAGAATRAPRVSAAQAELLDSLARAASQGLLELNVPTTPAETTSSIHTDPFQIPFATEAQTGLAEVNDVWPEETAEAVQPGISVQTAVDRDRPRGEAVETEASDATCIDDGMFDLAAWGGEGDFSDQIAPRLSALTTDRDVIPEGAVEALARTYLHFGFGAEAEQALTLDGRRTPEREVLRAIGRIIDDEPLNSQALQGQSGCAQPVALWSALARGTISGTTEAERIAILSAHRVLPVALRSHLGPRLAQLFLNASEAETAQAILAASVGARDTTPPAPTLTEAEVTLAIDGPEEALATLETLAGDENRATPETVVALIDLSLASDTAVPDDLLNLAASLRFENRGTAAERMLAEAELRALVAADRFADAIRLLTNDFAALPSDLTQEQAEFVIIAAAERMADGAFVDLAFAPLPQPLSSAAENALARRLLDLGFVEAAADLVAGPAGTDAMAERRQLRARADMALGQPQEGVAELAGMTDPASVAIRAIAAGGSDSHNAPLPEEMWRNGDWSGLGQAADPLLQAVSAAMLSGPQVSGPDTTLAERQAILDRAMATRDLATELLARFAIDSEEAAPATN